MIKLVNCMKAVIYLDVPEWQIGQPVHVFFKDTMEKHGICEAEARIVPFDDIQNYEALWLEVKDVDDEIGLAPWVKTERGLWFSPLERGEAIKEMRMVDEDEYNRVARCWTARPTDKQRKEVKWDDKP